MKNKVFSEFRSDADPRTVPRTVPRQTKATKLQNSQKQMQNPSKIQASSSTNVSPLIRRSESPRPPPSNNVAPDSTTVSSIQDSSAIRHTRSAPPNINGLRTFANGAPPLGKSPLSFKISDDLMEVITKTSSIPGGPSEPNKPDTPARSPKQGQHTHLLSEWPATAIAGNDLLSSILYTIGLCSAVAGRWTPLSLAIVTAGILYPFRKIYGEIGAAMPQNGGSFNCILQLWNESGTTHDEEEMKNRSPVSANSSASPKDDSSLLPIKSPRSRTFASRVASKLETRKLIAAVAGVLSLLSYISTAVVSAASAILYGAGQFENIKPYTFELTLLILVAFALITICGLKESASVAMVIFTIHCSMLVFLLCGGLYHATVVMNFEVWKQNFLTTDAQAKESFDVGTGSSALNVFYGVATGLLGITGFETSSNYIEEQAPGVFPKTLRNMWILVTIMNPLLSVVALGVVPLSDVQLSKDYLLSVVAERAISPSFRSLLAADAVLALSGGALTAYIGVCGLVMRMSQEGMFPAVLLSRHSVTGSHYNIIGCFMILTSLLYVMTDGDITALGGVYTISFLGVLGLATAGCMIIRSRKRKAVPSVQVLTWDVVVATVAIVAGITGQIALHPVNFLFFTYYFVAFMMMVVVFMLVR